MGNPLSGVGGDLWVTATPSIGTTNESCTDSGDHITYSAATHVFWDFNSTFTVQNSPNGSSSWVTITDYTVQWAAGRIVFNTARTPGVNNFTRISVGSYFASTQADASFAWDIALKGLTKDTTSFQSTGSWVTVTPTLRGAVVKLSTYRNDDRYTKELNNMLGVTLYVDKTNNIRWQLYAINDNTSPSSDVNNVQKQTISLASVRDAYYLTT